MEEEVKKWLKKRLSEIESEMESEQPQPLPRPPPVLPVAKPLPTIKVVEPSAEPKPTVLMKYTEPINPIVVEPAPIKPILVIIKKPSLHKQKLYSRSTVRIFLSLDSPKRFPPLTWSLLAKSIK